MDRRQPRVERRRTWRAPLRTSRTCSVSSLVPSVNGPACDTATSLVLASADGNNRRTATLACWKSGQKPGQDTDGRAARAPSFTGLLFEAAQEFSQNRAEALRVLGHDEVPRVELGKLAAPHFRH